MSVGQKLAQFHQTIENGYDKELFNELWHDDYEGYSNSTQKRVKKADLEETMRGCVGVKMHSLEVLYENSEVLVSEWKVTFPTNSARPEGSYTVVEYNALKDGKIIAHRTGMTKTG